MNKLTAITLTALLLVPLAAAHAVDNDGVLATVDGAAVSEANRVAEITLNSEKTYQNPFMEVELDAIITRPNGTQLRVPSFWAGGNRWCFRYASAMPGLHTWRSECSDKSNLKLHGLAGKIEVAAYRGENMLYKHGPVRVAKDQRHFAHADGTPFFWLGDTWWKGLCNRISWDGFQQLTADRKAKGYTVIQIIGGGPFPDEPLFDDRWKNEGGMPYEKDFERLNPAYFEYADRRIEHLIDNNMVPAIVGGWGWNTACISNETIGGRERWFQRHWRYLIARYGAHPVIWIVAGEMRHPYLNDLAKYVRANDPYKRLTAMHPPGVPEMQSGRKVVKDEAFVDFDFLQTAHNEWASAPITVSQVTMSYSKTPPMPVVNGEVTYEWHKNQSRHDLQRFMFWTCILNGAAGHTYGAGGIWQMNTETVHGSTAYETIPWHVAMHYPGSAQLGLGKKLLEEYPWWRFEPHPEWVELHSTTLLEPHAEWYDNHQKWAELKGRWDLPYAAGIPGEVRFIYIPGNNDYQLKAPTVLHLEPDAHYRAFLFDPVWGKRIDLGPAIKSDTYQPPQLPSPQDWVLVLERVKP